MANKIASKNITLNIQTGTESTLYAQWIYSKAHTKHFLVQWDYATGQGIWFDGSNSTIEKQANTKQSALYNIPSNAIKVRFRIKPISTTHKVNGNDTEYWTASWSDWIIYKVPNKEDHTPATPTSAPSITLIGYKLTAEYATSDENSVYCQFQLVEDENIIVGSQIVSKSLTGVFSCTFSVSAGHTYKVRCRGAYGIPNSSEDVDNWIVASMETYGSKSIVPSISEKTGNNNFERIGLTYGEWSAYSSSSSTIPVVPIRVICSALTETSVKIMWNQSVGADGYIVEYTTDEEFFDHNPTAVDSKDFNSKVGWGIIDGLESGTIYYFRVKAKNSVGESGWSSIVSVILGAIPNSPTTWSSSTTAVLGEDVVLYWVHNSTDGSEEKEAKLRIIRNGNQPIEEIILPKESTGISQYIFKTDNIKSDSEVSWSVKTRGILPEFSEDSIIRTFNIYTPPMVYITLYKSNKWWWDPFNFNEDSIYTARGDFDDPYDLDDVITQYPIYICATTEPSTQKPIAAHLSIYTTEAYQETDATGEEVWVNAGDEIFSMEPNLNTMWETDTGYQIPIVLLPSNIYLENGILYRGVFTVNMDNGLTAETEFTFTVQLEDDEYDLEAEIGYDAYTVSTYIKPRCVMGEPEFELGTPPKLPSEDEDEEEESKGSEDYELVSGIQLSLYRRDYDGKFIEIISNIDNMLQTMVTDPHPTLGYARYRIVATNLSTGKIFFTDLPSYPIPERAIILQWDQKWHDFNVDEPDELSEPVFTGSFLKLPYNISVSDSASPNVELVEYIGREHPVSYYGTQVGQTSSWSLEFPREDVETLYALRRLSRFMGDVYVREPNGSGYWANITISWNIANKAVSIPVTINVKRVEGGV